MQYIKPEESIILNVISASQDFRTCESISMSQRVDKSGQRTLAVVTKADNSPEGLLEKVTANDVNIGLGYICVRNRIGSESFEDARVKEAQLFDTHPLLSKIDKSMVGIPVLAQRLVQIQATIISKCLPEIVRKVNDKLNASVSELNKMRPNFSSASEAIAAFMQIIGLSKESLRKILLRGEFDEYPDDKFMHSTARLVEMLNNYSEELQKSSENNYKDNFLVEEIRVLEEGQVIGLPNFIPRAAFKALLQKKVNKISSIPISFVSKVWDYIETVVINVLMQHSENYPQLQSSTRRAAQNLIAKIKEKFGGRVNEIIEMERLTDYTCDPDYMASWKKLMLSYNLFLETMNDRSKPTKINIEGFGVVEVSQLRSSPTLTTAQAYNLKMRIIAYWNIVLKRLVDFMALHLEWSVEKFVSQEMEVEIVNELVGGEGWGGIERLLEESPSIARKRERLDKSIGLLRESKEVLVKVMDKIYMDNN